jgi:hypothetical protein
VIEQNNNFNDITIKERKNNESSNWGIIIC